jgi:hypothetical protein
MIHFSNSFQRGNITESLELSLPHFERVDLLLQNLIHSEVTQSTPPGTAFHRPLSWLTSQIQDSTSMETLHFFTTSTKSLDPGEVPQVAVAGLILCQFNKQSISPLDLALCELFIGAFFYAMRSCKYIQVTGQRKTKLLALRNIRFFIGNKILHHGSNSLHLADTVSITFEFQKRDAKNDVITHHKMNDKLLCPVKIWGKINHRIYHYNSSNPNTTVNTYLFEDGSVLLFTGAQLLKHLRLAALIIGPDSLGFTAGKIGLHSAHSGAAMAMYLAGVPIFTIMLLGCWSSNAFL